MENLEEYRQLLLERYIRFVEDLEVAASASGEAVGDASGSDWVERLSDLVTHLLDTETRFYVPFFERIQAEDFPCLSGLDDPSTGTGGRTTAGQTLLASLAEYRNLRQHTAGRLEALPPQVWNRLGRHPWWGVRTLQWWVEQCQAHARRHFQQLKQTKGNNQKDGEAYEHVHDNPD